MGSLEAQRYHRVGSTLRQGTTLLVPPSVSVSCWLWPSQRKGYLWERKGDSPQTPGNSPKEGNSCHSQDLGDGHTSTVKRILTWPQKHLWHCKCFTQILGFLLPFSYTLFQLLLPKNKSPPNLSGLRQEPSFILLLILQFGHGRLTLVPCSVRRVTQPGDHFQEVSLTWLAN